MPQTTRLTITQPDDWHAHFRQGCMLKVVLPHTARAFGRAIAMPNLKPPVTTSQLAAAYRQEIMAALPTDSTFKPLMTVYLTDTTDPLDLEKGFKDGIVTAAKLYPANATTNSEFGVTKIENVYPTLEIMQKLGIPLLMHGEVTDSAIDIFDREAVFIEKVLQKVRRDFPELKIVFEHVTTRQAVDYVLEEGEKGFLGATITAHHLMINRNAIFVGGIKPHHYCLPIAKREEHRQALVKAATSGAKMFFIGTDSAPHMRATKECACGCAGIFTAVNALELYTQVFDEADALHQFEKFASLNGAAFYGLPANQSKITLERCESSPTLPTISVVGEQGTDVVVPFQAPSGVFWRIVQ